MRSPAHCNPLAPIPAPPDPPSVPLLPTLDFKSTKEGRPNKDGKSLNLSWYAQNTCDMHDCRNICYVLPENKPPNCSWFIFPCSRVHIQTFPGSLTFDLPEIVVQYTLSLDWQTNPQQNKIVLILNNRTSGVLSQDVTQNSLYFSFTLVVS